MGIRLTLELGEPIELLDFPGVPVQDIPTDAYPPKASLVSYSFLGTLGIQRFKQVMLDAANSTGQTMSVPQMVEALDLQQFQNIVIESGLRKDKEKTETANGVEVPLMWAELVRFVVA